VNRSFVVTVLIANLGNAYRKAGNLDKAKAACRSGLTVFPDAETIWKALEAMD
jgi:hypothetical protein